MLMVLKRILRIALALYIAIGLSACAAFTINESGEPDVDQKGSAKRIPLPPTIKDLDRDPE